jgi:hypothetical protein
VRQLAATGALALVALGCGGDATELLEWRYRFADDATRAAATSLEARILRGGCGSADVHYRTAFPVEGSGGSAPPVLDDGFWGFSIRAMADDCRVVAEDCADRTLPSSEAILNVLEGPGGPPPCSAAATCVAGVCIEPDAGVMRVDGGPAPDGGPPARDAGCVAAFGDCDGDPSNGFTTTEHCGACGVSCVRPFSYTACSVGGCALLGCADGYSDCDGIAENGCEQAGECLCAGAGNECTFECTGGCTARCTAGTRCTVRCTQLPCAVHCENGATQCELDCPGSSGSCTSNCSSRPDCYHECPVAVCSS